MTAAWRLASAIHGALPHSHQQKGWFQSTVQGLGRNETKMQARRKRERNENENENETKLKKYTRKRRENENETKRD